MISLKWHQQTVSICPISTAPCTPVRAATARRARICLLPQNLLLASSFLAQSELAWLRFWARLRPSSVRPSSTSRGDGSVAPSLSPSLSLWLNVVAGKRGYSIQGCWVGWKREGRNNRYHAVHADRTPLIRECVSLACWIGPVSMYFFNVFIRMLCLFGYCY